MERRHFIRAGIAGSVGVGAATAGAAALHSVPPRRQRVLRFAHVTDVHVEAAKARAPEGFARALRRIEEMDDQPAFILNGGDAIYDGVARDREDTRAQWRLWNDIVARESTLPFVHCLGNHDVWGWKWHDDPQVRADARYGKAWALDELGMPGRYHAGEHAGWKLIVLDSTHIDGDSYVGRLDPEQLEWFEGELRATPPSQPVIVASHIPIVTFAAHIWFGGDPTAAQLGIIRRNLIHSDAVRLKDLLHAHPNVKLCLSGHLHMQERIEYLGITYACSGAVCGNWWNEQTPSFQEFGPAIALVDCYDDGRAEHTMVQLG